jgi:P27 family predicted phage terminase small subunit
MKGRKPKPIATHKLDGTYRKDRHGSTEVIALPTSTPEPPEHLDAESLAEWHRLVSELVRLGTLHRIDRVLLATFCQLWSRLVAAEKGISEHGLIIKGTTGAAQISPFYSVAIRTAKELRSIAAELGLSPTSRTRLRVEPPTETPRILKRDRRA